MNTQSASSFRQVAIGETFHTGHKAPVSGVYEFVRHLDNTFCSNLSLEEKYISLTAGETFPPHRKCGGKGVIWKLIRLS